MSALLDLEKAIFLDVFVVVYRRMFAFGCRVLLVNQSRNRVSGGSVRRSQLFIVACQRPTLSSVCYPQIHPQQMCVLDSTAAAQGHTLSQKQTSEHRDFHSGRRS